MKICINVKIEVPFTEEEAIQLEKECKEFNVSVEENTKDWIIHHLTQLGDIKEKHIKLIDVLKVNDEHLEEDEHVEELFN